MNYSKNVELLEPIDLSEHLDKVELYLGQVCQIAGISKMQLDYWTNKAQIPTKGKKQRIYDIDELEAGEDRQTRQHLDVPVTGVVHPGVHGHRAFKRMEPAERFRKQAQRRRKQLALEGAPAWVLERRDQELVGQPAAVRGQQDEP